MINQLNNFTWRLQNKKGLLMNATIAFCEQAILFIQTFCYKRRVGYGG
jgi:hypothetical protein